MGTTAANGTRTVGRKTKHCGLHQQPHGDHAAQLEAMVCGSMCGWMFPAHSPSSISTEHPRKERCHHRPHQTSCFVHLLPSEGASSYLPHYGDGSLLYRLFLYAQDDDGRTAGLHLPSRIGHRRAYDPRLLSARAKRKLYPIPGERFFPTYHGTI